MAQIGYDAQSDLENTADSVFCAHGAGFIVPWDQVFSYMHLPPVLGQDKSGEEWYPGQWLPDAANFHAKTGRKKPGSARKRLTESLTGHTMLIRKTKMPAQRTAIKEAHHRKQSRFCFRRWEAEGCRRGISAGGRL